MTDDFELGPTDPIHQTFLSPSFLLQCPNRVNLQHIACGDNEIRQEAPSGAVRPRKRGGGREETRGAVLDPRGAMLHLKSSVAHCDLAKLRSWVAFRGFWVGTRRDKGFGKALSQGKGYLAEFRRGNEILDVPKYLTA